MIQSPADIVAGQRFEFDYPFIWAQVVLRDDEWQEYKKFSWRPGVSFERNDHGERDAFAEGLGKQIIVVISVHKPGRYPTRVFYTRRWLTPDGKEFGKTKLLIKTLDAFRRLVRGYRYEYDLEEQKP